MKHDDHFATFSKTQKQMYSTMVPMSTPRRRYQQKQMSTAFRRSVLDRNNPEPSQFIPTLSKDLKDPRKHLNFANLPELKKPKSFMLQQWLNQALEGGGQVDIAPNNEPLKTLKKYSLDKGNLRNFNLSFQTIQRLHTTLFIYSEGIKNIFNQMLTQAGDNDSSLPKLYFKVFLKLLENIMPIKTCFHAIEQSLKKQICELKKQKNQLLFKVQEQKKNTLAIENKLKKDIQSLENKIKKMATDFQIMESSLQMYEVSFNDEVALRLKFQEKINIAYTCYEELKDKYQSLRQEFGNKANALADNNMEQMSIKDQLHSQTLKNVELLRQVQHLQHKLATLQGEILMKNQQIKDLCLMNRKEQEQKATEESVVDELMLKVKLLKKQKEDDCNKIQDLNKGVVKYQETIQKLKNDLAYARDKNDEIYIKYHQKTLQIIPLQKQIYEKSLKISALSAQNSSLLSSKTLLSQQLAQATLQLTEAQNLQSTANKDILLYNSQIEKMKATITQLKEVKDKYERLNSKLQQEIAEAKRQLQIKVMEIVESKGRCVDLQFHLSELQKVKNDYQAKMYQLQKTLRKKEQELDERKGLERKKIREVEGQVQRKSMELQKNKQAFLKLSKESNLKDSERMKKLEEITFLRKNTTILEAENQQFKIKINQLKVQNQRKQNEIQTLQKEIEARNFTISKRRQEIDGQIVNLKLKISQLKQQINRRAQYAHPMIVEDMKQQITRLYNTIETINQTNAEFNRTYYAIQNELQQKRKQVLQLTQKLSKFKQNLERSSLQLCNIREEKIREQQKRGARQEERKIDSKKKDKIIESLRNTIKIQEEQIQLKNKDQAKIQNELDQYQRQINRSKNISIDNFTQTDSINCEKVASSIQTDNYALNSSLNGRKLTTSDRLRNKIQDPQSKQVDLAIEQKKTDLNQINEQKSSHEKQAFQTKGEKKVQDREFKAALRLTYMRK